MEVVHERCAGLDIGKRLVVGAIRVPGEGRAARHPRYGPDTNLIEVRHASAPGR